MPSYDPFCQLKLAADAYASLDETSPPVIHYLGFWSSFYQLAPGQTENSLQCMFRALLTGHGLRASAPIYIVSVFESPAYYSTTLPQLRRNAPPDALWVGFSGEPRELPWEWFHLNIVMKPESLEQHTVSLPNFVSNVYEMGLWPYLQMPRPVRYCPHKQKFCAFVVQNGGNGVRNQFTRLLSQTYKSVDCAGSWMNNMPGGATAPVDARVYGDRYLGFLQGYKFVICFENCAQPANLTEKLLNAWMSGAIPIYWGCPNVLQWLNPRAFLYLEDNSHAAMKRLIERIRELDTDPEKYTAIWNEPLIDPVRGIPKEWTLSYLRECIQTIFFNK
jgi:hypothetical protein